MNSNQIPSSSKTIEDTNAFDEELDIHPIGDSKLLQGLPKTEAFTGYKVQIDKTNYFELDGFILRLNDKEIRIFNLRSIRGHIGCDFTRKGDKLLEKIVHDYLTHTDNVELLNILSVELNGFNWFEVYSDDFIDLDIHTKEELMGIKNIVPMKHAACAACLSGEENSVPIDTFIKEVRSTKNNHLLPQALMNHLHEGITPYVKHSIDEFDYFPIWYINGARTSNADYCELYCPLEVIIHILSKRFVQFKAKLLTLASTDIQLAVEKGEKLDDYTQFRKHQLIEACHAKDDKIDKLTNKVIDLTNIVVDQTKTIQEQNKTIQTQSNMIQDQSAKIDLLINMNVDQNDKIDTLIDVQYNTKGEINDLHEDIKYQTKTIQLMDKSIGWACHEIGHISMRQTITDATTDIIVLYTSMIKPIDKGRKPQAQDGEVWIASYVGDADNYKEPNIPEDAHELYRINANRLNSFKKMINAPEVQPFILNVYDRSMLINEDHIDEFIDAVDHVLNEEGQFKSIKHLEYMHNEIEKRKIERQRRKKHEEYIEFKRKVLETYKTPHIYLRARSRLVYIKEIDEEGKTSLIPLKDVDDEIAMKQKWWFRYGTDGINNEKLSKSSILSGKYTSIGDSRIKYED